MRRLGVYVRLGDHIDPAANELIQRVALRLLDDLHAGVTDVQPGYTTLYVEYDARRAERSRDRCLAGRLTSTRRAPGRRRRRQLRARPDASTTARTFAAVCEATGLARHEVIDLHSGRDYRVFAVGAAPGFPFLGVLDERLQHAAAPDAARARAGPRGRDDRAADGDLPGAGARAAGS